MTGAATSPRSAQIHGTVAYLAGHLTLWQYHGQLGALDDYLRNMAVRRQTGALPQYKKFREVVREAALLLRASPAVPLTAGPAQPPAVTAAGDAGAVVVVGHEPSDTPLATSPRVLAQPPGEPGTVPGEDTDPFYRLDSATGNLVPAPLDEAREANLAEYVRLHDEEDGGEAAPELPGPAAGPPDAAGPGSSEAGPARNDAEDESRE